MKALSLHEPWATLIAIGKKSIETRSWRPPDYLIGKRIAIHAAKRKPDHSTLQALMGDFELLPRGYQRQPLTRCVFPNDLRPSGAIVATAVLKETHQVQQVLSKNKIYSESENIGRLILVDLYGDFSPGRWLWILTDIEKVDPPIPAMGHQGLWEWE